MTMVILWNLGLCYYYTNSSGIYRERYKSRLEKMEDRFLNTVKELGRQVAQSVERRTLEAEVRGSKPVLGTWWWGRIPPNQSHPKGAAPAATTLLAEW